MQEVKKHRNWDSRVLTKNAGFVHLVKIPWHGQSSHWWNDSCADIIEVFGLPGDRFISHPKIGEMEFYFKSEKDASLCKILLSDKI